MKLRSTTAAAALVIGAMTVGMTTAHADDAPAQPAGIDYSTKLVDGKTVVSTLKNGTFELAQQDGATPDAPKQTIVTVKDGQGAQVVSFPLSFSVQGTDIPVKADLKNDAKVLEVVPEKPAGFQPSDQKLVANVKPIASDTENARAMNDFSTKFGLAVGIGTFVGTAVGAIVGFLFGLPLFGVGGLLGLPTGAAIGGILGTIALGGPTLLAAGIDLLNTISAAPGTTRWSDQAQAAQQGPASTATPVAPTAN